MSETFAEIDLVAVASGEVELPNSELLTQESSSNYEVVDADTVCSGVASAACLACVIRGDCPILRMKEFVETENLELDYSRESYLDELLNDDDDSLVVAGFAERKQTIEQPTDTTNPSVEKIEPIVDSKAEPKIQTKAQSKDLLPTKPQVRSKEKAAPRLKPESKLEPKSKPKLETVKPKAQQKSKPEPKPRLPKKEILQDTSIQKIAPPTKNAARIENIKVDEVVAVEPPLAKSQEASEANNLQNDLPIEKSEKNVNNVIPAKPRDIAEKIAPSRSQKSNLKIERSTNKFLPRQSKTISEKETNPSLDLEFRPNIRSEPKLKPKPNIESKISQPIIKLYAEKINNIIQKTTAPNEKPQPVGDKTKNEPAISSEKPIEVPAEKNQKVEIFTQKEENIDWAIEEQIFVIERSENEQRELEQRIYNVNEDELSQEFKTETESSEELSNIIVVKKTTLNQNDQQPEYEQIIDENNPETPDQPASSSLVDSLVRFIGAAAILTTTHAHLQTREV